MTTSAYFAIMLALFLGVAIMAAMRYRALAYNFRHESRSHLNLLNAYRRANRSPNAYYSVQRVEATLPEYSHIHGCWGVCRRVVDYGIVHTTTIKVFTDDDDDFNRREAEELCDMLNSK